MFNGNSHDFENILEDVLEKSKKSKTIGELAQTLDDGMIKLKCNEFESSIDIDDDKIVIAYHYSCGFEEFSGYSITKDYDAFFTLSAECTVEINNLNEKISELKLISIELKNEEQEYEG